MEMVLRKSFYSSYVTNHLEKIVSEKIAINETIINYLDGTKPAYSKQFCY